MADEKIKTKIEELENKLKQQQLEIDKINKKVRRSKWLIASLLCDNDK